MILINTGGPGGSGTESVQKLSGKHLHLHVDLFSVFFPRPTTLGLLNVSVCAAKTIPRYPDLNSESRPRTPNLTTRSVPRMPDDYHNSFIQLGISIGSQCAAEAGGELDPHVARHTETGGELDPHAVQHTESGGELDPHVARNKDSGGELDPHTVKHTERAGELDPHSGPHMSTATTARDMLSIVDAFAATEDGQRAARPSHLLNYYGVSYGSFLGQTFASMFPGRVGNMVLDGVVDPQSYLDNSLNTVTHADGVLAGFFIFCHELGPEDCPYHTGSAARDIHARFARSYAQLDAEKAREENWANATDIELALLNLKSGILFAAFNPIKSFGDLATNLLYLEVMLQAQRLSDWNSWMVTSNGNASPAGWARSGAELSMGVMCSDQGNIWYNKTLDDFRPVIDVLEEDSIVGDIWAKFLLGCAGWSIKAAERFAGPFTGDTATPILFVGNTYDPVTPVENALSSAQKYKGAQALVIDAFGHGMIWTLNHCGFEKVAKYFKNGELPGDDSFCAFEGDKYKIPFSLSGTLEQSIREAGLANLRS
ncbi:hypothetical protein KVR01_006308 [Diaporthe batatas]|uniref:uncharacterized protein n=1 Tax=Diaporthe batatas TaxID=748121 RepID=UPI001D03680E|nr:uncharacterized protein KVR01_006308 [Diaporthe batatas]KAG8164390.1 hypothetical protein KVR01_006308 [Diaporthe batatas]